MAHDTTRQTGPDLLRALAILMVMSGHLPEGDYPLAFNLFKSFGWLGVDIFFVLSGYLIGSQLLKRVRDGQPTDLIDFYIKRGFRILPVFLLILGLYAFWPALREAQTMAPLWRFLTFTVNFGLDVDATRAFTHAWSLCVEEHFYLLLPLIIVALRPSRSPWPAIAAVVLVFIAGLILRDQLWQMWFAQGQGAAPFLKILYYPSYTRMDGLTMGVVLAAVRVFRPGTYHRLARPAFSLPLGGICVFASLFMAAPTGITLSHLAAVLVYPFFAAGIALILAGLMEIEPVLRHWRPPSVVTIALVSYSLYLSHKLTMHADTLLLPKAWLQGWSGVVLYYGTSIAVAAALYLAVERPFLALRDVVLHRRMEKPSRLPETAF